MQKRTMTEAFEGFSLSDIAQYLMNNSDGKVTLSELAGYQPYRSGDTQPSTSGTDDAKALIYATGKGQSTAGKKIRKTSKDWQGLTFEQYLKWDLPDEGQGASSRSGTELEELADESHPKIFPQKGTGYTPGVNLPGSVPGRA